MPVKGVVSFDRFTASYSCTPESELRKKQNWLHHRSKLLRKTFTLVEGSVCCLRAQNPCCSLKHVSMQFPAVLLLFPLWQVSTVMPRQYALCCSCEPPLTSLLLSYKSAGTWLFKKGFILNLMGVLNRCTRIMNIEPP